MENSELFNRQAAISAQKEYVAKTQAPHFAPPDGNCWACRKNIYDNIPRGERNCGITVEKAGIELVTGCPHCNRSYCD